MATLIKETGVIKHITPANESDFTLEELQDYVNDNIDIITIDDKHIMVVNEDGKHNCLINPKATIVAIYNNAIYPFDYIAGDVIICKSEEVK